MVYKIHNFYKCFANWYTSNVVNMVTMILNDFTALLYYNTDSDLQTIQLVLKLTQPALKG